MVRAITAQPLATNHMDDSAHVADNSRKGVFAFHCRDHDAFKPAFAMFGLKELIQPWLAVSDSASDVVAEF